MVRYIERRGEVWQFVGVHLLAVRSPNDSTASHTRSPRYPVAFIHSQSRVYVPPKKFLNTETNSSSLQHRSE